MTGNVIDSFFVALGFKVDQAGLRELEQKAKSVQSTVQGLGDTLRNVFKTAAAAYAVREVAAIGNEWEQNKIQIAGFFAALKFSPDFQSGLKLAEDTIRQITIDAAALPGEADEYITVFKAGLPFLKAALPGAAVGELTKFSNKFAAIGKTLGVDAEQIGRDMALMLGSQGRAGGHVRTFQQMLPFMKDLKGQTDLNAQSFNAMTQPQRVALLKQAFVGLQPMLDASANSFDAMWGAAKSALKTMVRLATTRVFDGMKGALKALTATFIDSDGHLTEFSQGIVDSAAVIAKWVIRFVGYGAQMILWLGKTKGAALALKFALVALAGSLAAAAWTKFSGVVMGVVKSLRTLLFTAGGLKKLLTGGLVLAIGLVIEDLWVFYHGGQSLTGDMVKKWAPAIYVVKAALGLLVWALVRVQAAAVVTWLAALGPIGLVILAVLAIIATIYYFRDELLAAVDAMTAKWYEFAALLLDSPFAGLIDDIDYMVDGWTELNRMMTLTTEDLDQFMRGLDRIAGWFGGGSENAPAELKPGEGVMAAPAQVGSYGGMQAPFETPYMDIPDTVLRGPIEGPALPPPVVAPPLSPGQQAKADYEEKLAKFRGGRRVRGETGVAANDVRALQPTGLPGSPEYNAQIQERLAAGVRAAAAKANTIGSPRSPAEGPAAPGPYDPQGASRMMLPPRSSATYAAGTAPPRSDAAVSYSQSSTDIHIDNVHVDGGKPEKIIQELQRAADRARRNKEREAAPATVR